MRPLVSPVVSPRGSVSTPPGPRGSPVSQQCELVFPRTPGRFPAALPPVWAGAFPPKVPRKPRAGCGKHYLPRVLCSPGGPETSPIWSRGFLSASKRPPRTRGGKNPRGNFFGGPGESPGVVSQPRGEAQHRGLFPPGKGPPSCPGPAPTEPGGAGPPRSGNWKGIPRRGPEPRPVGRRGNWKPGPGSNPRRVGTGSNSGTGRPPKGGWNPFPARVSQPFQTLNRPRDFRPLRFRRLPQGKAFQGRFPVSWNWERPRGGGLFPRLARPPKGFP